MSKLDWQYDDRGSEEIATVRPGIRIRAVRDDCAQNPFTDGDCNWPIVVRSGERHGDRFTTYDTGVQSRGFNFDPLRGFNDAQLRHWQIHIAKAFNSTVRDLIDTYGNSDDALPEGRVACHDADVLRDVFAQAWDDWSDSDRFDLAVELYQMIDIVALAGQTTGYSQGDWAEVLVIAHPDHIKRFGCATPPTAADLQGTIDLYGAWAWGDVYGYIVEHWVPAEDSEPEDFDPEFDEGEWVDDGSCWGYYGADHAASGLEESALECVPEPEPERELADA